MSSPHAFFVSRSTDEVLRVTRASPPDGWSLLTVPCGFVHPALVDTIAAALGIAADDVRAVARFEAAIVDGHVQRPAAVPVDEDALFDEIDFEHAGTAALRSALGSRADLLLDVVPVIPVEARPNVRSDDPAVRVERTHPITSAYTSLSRNVEHLARLNDLSAPSVLIAAQHRAVQLAVERLITRVRGEEPPAPPQVARPPMPLAKPPTKWEQRPRGACALLFLDDKRLLVQDARSARVLRLRDGAITREVRIALPARYVAFRRVVFADAAAYAFVEGGLHGIALLDAARDTFDTKLTAERPVRLLTQGISGPDEILAWDPHAQSGAAIDVSFDDAAPGSYTHDGAFAWTLGPEYHGAIVELATGNVFARAEDFPFEQPALDRIAWDGTIKRGAPFDVDPERRVTAVALTAERRYRLLGPNGVVLDDHRPLFGLAFRPEAAAWSPDAQRLALVRRGEVILVQVGAQPRIVARYPSRPASTR